MATREQTLLDALEEGKNAVRAALMDDFDTPCAAQALLVLVKESNKYLESEADGELASGVIASVARYVTSMLRTFGLINSASDIGFPLEGAEGGADKEETLTPLLDVLTKFRESVRIAAMSGDSKAVLRAADDLRDLVLPEVGVRMEDQVSSSSSSGSSSGSSSICLFVCLSLCICLALTHTNPLPTITPL